ncbi:MAG: DUF373 family protein, partial [Thermoprotei archaeon]
MPGRRLLILAVDVDDDMSKTGITTPIVGRAAVADAANRLAVISPEDTDVNAIFGALKEYDGLSAKNEDELQIAVVVGAVEGGVTADLRIREQVSSVVDSFKPDGIVFVSDGGEDERVLPIVQSVCPLFSIRRITVQYSKGVEETYMVLASYIRKGLTEPRFVKYTMGIPGIILVTFAVLAIFGLFQLSLYFIGMLLGLILIVRGFKVPEMVVRTWDKEPISFVGMVVSGIVILAAFVTDVEIALSHTQITHGLDLIVFDTFDYYVLAVAVYFSSVIVNSYMQNDLHFWKDVTAIVFALSIR